MLSKIFFGQPNKMALGVRKWPFLAENFKFWPKMAIFSGPKIFKKKFFVLKCILDYFKSFPEKKFFAKKISYLKFFVLGPRPTYIYIYICVYVHIPDFRKFIPGIGLIEW